MWKDDSDVSIERNVNIEFHYISSLLLKANSSTQQHNKDSSYDFLLHSYIISVEKIRVYSKSISLLHNIIIFLENLTCNTNQNVSIVP